MVDYKELIELLREWDESCISDLCGKDILNCDDLCINRGAECIVHQAITAIETLLEERDAAVEMLRGQCHACSHNAGWHNVGKCCTCKHETAGPLIPVEQCDDNWQWCGPKKEAGD